MTSAAASGSSAIGRPGAGTHGGSGESHGLAYAAVAPMCHRFYFVPM